MRFTSYIWTSILILLFALSLTTNWYDLLVYSLNIVCVLMVLDKLGKGIVWREIIALHSAFICLLMPLVGFLVYNTTNAMALLWVRYMPIDKATFFNFCLPAVTGFCLMLCWPIRSETSSDEGAPLRKLVQNVKEYLEGNQRIGIYLLAIGIVINFFVIYLPTGLQFIFNLFYFSAFAGLLYVYFSGKFRYKNLVLIGFGLFILWGSLRSGMFTIVAYMGMTLFSFFFIGRKASMFKKVVYFLASFLLLALIQSIKQQYRRAIFKNPEANQAVLFADLATERLSNLEEFVSPNAYFFLYFRANQGFNVALVMKRFPAIAPYDDGANLFVNIASSFVPRVLWPDKPEAGGIANMKYYTGITISGWSTNVGPLGEAYASFGVTGGIICMMCLGFFIRFAYKRVFVIARKIPLIVLWIPVMFYQITYSAENDTLQILNSLLKSAFFVFLLYKLMPGIFKPSKKKPVFPEMPSNTGVVKQLQTN